MRKEMKKFSRHSEANLSEENNNIVAQEVQ
jgi:hypothetical protein